MKILLVLFLALPSPAVSAPLEIDIIQTSDFDVYWFVRNTCHDLDRAFFEKYLEISTDAFQTLSDTLVLEFDRFQQAVGRGGMHKHIDLVLHSPAAERALQYCYGDNQEAKDFYMSYLIYVNQLGLFSGGVVAPLGAVRLIGLGLKRISQKSWIPIKSFLLRYRIVSQTSTKIAERLTTWSIQASPFYPALLRKHLAHQETLEFYRGMSYDQFQTLNDLLAELPTLENTEYDLKYKTEALKFSAILILSLKDNPFLSDRETEKLKQIEKEVFEIQARHLRTAPMNTIVF